MAYYLIELSFTDQAWTALTKNPQNRAEAVRPIAENLGGSLQGAWFSFTDYDLVALFQLPDNVSHAALNIAFRAGGAIKAIKASPLITMEEGMVAMSQAGASGYRPPQQAVN